jgi:nucleotide-binding universal stress UspA family protein
MAQVFASATDARLRAVHAWRRTVSEVKPRTADRLRAQAADAVRGWAEQVGSEIESEQIEGDPRDVLVTAAQRFAPALTVVGRRGAGGLRSISLGSTANHVIRFGTTNVVVVPDPEPASP